MKFKPWKESKKSYEKSGQRHTLCKFNIRLLFTVTCFLLVDWHCYNMHSCETGPGTDNLELQQMCWGDTLYKSRVFSTHTKMFSIVDPLLIFCEPLSMIWPISTVSYLHIYQKGHDQVEVHNTTVLDFFSFSIRVGKQTKREDCKRPFVH